MTDKRKKILFFTPSGVGGAERVTLTIAKMLPRDEYEVKVVFVSRDIGDLKDFVPEWMPIIHIKTRNIWDFTTLKIYSLFRKEKPYAVFCSLIHLCTRIAFAAKFAGIIKSIFRSNISSKRWRWDYRFLGKMIFKHADTIIMQTEEMKNDFEDDFPKLKNVVVIPNPIDTETIERKLMSATNPLDPQKTNYVYTGRLHAVKGLDTLLKSFAIVKKQIPDVKLTIVGSTTQEPRNYALLTKLVEELELADSVEFAGFQDNPYKYVKHADCFVLPSRNEGYPNALLEAMYLQTPVVATRSVPIIDRIVTADRGIVVDVDDTNALSNAMVKALTIKITKAYECGNNNEFIKLFR